MSRSRIRALLIDLSGTLHVGAEPIAGAAKAIQRLRDHGVPFRFCSNTSKESTRALLKRLRGAGFTVHEDELFTSLKAMKTLLTERDIKRPFFLLSPSAMEEFGDIFNQDDSSKRYDAVVVGLAPDSFTYSTLNQAFRILSSQENGTAEPGRIPLLTTHRARYVRSSSGELSLGPGPFVSALEVAVGEGCKAESVGKPARAFFEVCSRDLGLVTAKSEEEKAAGQLKFEDIAVVGDDIEADLGDGALELGLQRILVKTGKYRTGDESRTGITPPDSIYDSIAEFVNAILEERQETDS